MTHSVPSKEKRILAVSPSSLGVGYAVLEAFETLVDWGVKSIGKDKNTQSLAKVEELLKLYHPSVLVIEDVDQSRRAPRIHDLSRQIVSKAAEHKTRVVKLSLNQVKRALLGKETKTKHEVAVYLAEQFPEELGQRLPPKRKLWKSVDLRMYIFDALALALACQRKKRRPRKTR